MRTAIESIKAFLFLVAAMVVMPVAANAVPIGFSAVIDGGQAGTGSAVTGSGTFMLETSTGDFSYNISYGSFDTAELAAHIHTSEGGGVVFGLPAGNPKVGVQFGLSEPQQADLLAGLYYVNIHTEAFGAGEIRGQVLQIPEASTAMLLITGLIGLMGFGRRR